MNYVVLDLEMNSWQSKVGTDNHGKLFIIDGKKKLNIQFPFHETIEIGAIKLNENFEVIDTFQRFIKPVNPLTQWIQDFTGISPLQINEAKNFVFVMNEFLKWTGNDIKFCTWSNYDSKHLIKECRLKSYNKIENIKNLFMNYINIQSLFKVEFNKRAGIFGIGMKNDYGLKTTLKILNINNDTQHHKALDDAMDTVDIFASIHNGYLDYVTDVFRQKVVA